MGIGGQLFTKHFMKLSLLCFIRTPTLHLCCCICSLITLNEALKLGMIMLNFPGGYFCLVTWLMTEQEEITACSLQHGDRAGLERDETSRLRLYTLCCLFFLEDDTSFPAVTIYMSLLFCWFKVKHFYINDTCTMCWLFHRFEIACWRSKVYLFRLFLSFILIKVS